MKIMLRKLASPILNYFESGEEVFAYKESHRKILIAVGVLFLFLSSVSLFVTIKTGQYGGMIPILVFLSAGVVCGIVGFLGTDQAVARMWKTR